MGLNFKKQMTKKLTKELLEDLAIIFPPEEIVKKKPQMITAWLNLHSVINNIHDNTCDEAILGSITRGGKIYEVSLKQVRSWETGVIPKILIKIYQEDDYDLEDTIAIDLNGEKLTKLLKYSSTAITKLDDVEL